MQRAYGPAQYAGIIFTAKGYFRVFESDKGEWKVRKCPLKTPFGIRAEKRWKRERKERDISRIRGILPLKSVKNYGIMVHSLKLTKRGITDVSNRKS